MTRTQVGGDVVLLYNPLYYLMFEVHIIAQ